MPSPTSLAMILNALFSSFLILLLLTLSSYIFLSALMYLLCQSSPRPSLADVAFDLEDLAETIDSAFDFTETVSDTSLLLLLLVLKERNSSWSLIIWFNCYSSFALL